jgi:hypothetical protein
MKRNLSRAFGGITSVAAISLDGLHLLGPTLNVTFNTELVVGGDLDAMLKANNEYQAAKTARLTASDALSAADKQASSFIMVGRDLLKPKLGTRYSQAWNEVGFVNNTLSVPESVALRLALVKSMELYFSAHPEMEQVGTVTHVIAGELYDSLKAAVTAANVARTTMREKKKARDNAAKILSKRMRKLIGELKQVLDDDDDRWLEFGFNVPSDLSVPEAPEDLAVVPGIPGHLMASWGKPTGATRFRIFRQIVGVDAEPVHLETTTETSIDLGGMTAGAHVKLYVTAANAAGEGMPSETTEIVVP